MGCHAGKVLLSMLKEDDLTWVSEVLEIDPDQRFKKTFGLARNSKGPAAPRVESGAQTDPVLENGRGVGPERHDSNTDTAEPAPAAEPVKKAKKPAAALRCMKARQIVAQVYQGRITALDTAQREGKAPECMSLFYKEWLLHRHGLASIAAKQARALASSVLCFSVDGSNPQNASNARGERTTASYDKRLRLFGKLVGVGVHPGYDEGDNLVIMTVLKLLFPGDKLKGLAERMASSKGCFVELKEAEPAVSQALMEHKLIKTATLDEVVKQRLGQSVQTTADGRRLSRCLECLQSHAEEDSRGTTVIDIDAVLEATHMVWEERQADRVTYLGRVFASFDLDNDGVLSFAEFQALMDHLRSRFGLPSTLPSIAVSFPVHFCYQPARSIAHDNMRCLVVSPCIQRQYQTQLKESQTWTLIKFPQMHSQLLVRGLSSALDGTHVC